MRLSGAFLWKIVRLLPDETLFLLCGTIVSRISKHYRTIGAVLSTNDSNMSSKRKPTMKQTGRKPQPRTRGTGGVDPILQAQARQAARQRSGRRTGNRPTQQQDSPLQMLTANPLILGIAAVVALLLIILLVRSCTASGQEPTTSSEPQGSETTSVVTAAVDASTTYDWQNLTRENSRYVYSLDDQVVSRFGIDVSENNGDIDWEAVAADGVEFAFIRVGYRGNEEGGIHLDEKFEANIAGARAAGIEIGAYFYSQAITPEEGREEAQFCIRQLKETPLEYPIAFDSETHPEQDMRTDNTPRGELSAVAAAFCEEVKAAGYKPLIYGSSNDLARYKRDDLAAYPFWYAEFGGLPEPPSGFTFWQFHNDAIVGGISTPTDVNLDLTMAAEIQAGNMTVEDAKAAFEAKAAEAEAEANAATSSSSSSEQ